VPFSGICVAAVADVGVCIPIPKNIGEGVLRGCAFFRHLRCSSCRCGHCILILKNMGEGVLRERAFQRHLHALDDGLKLILLETKSFFCGEV
jgi:hypothetical protein